MKTLLKQSFIGLHLATLATLATIVSLPLLAISIAHAETNLNLNSGLSYINQQNLQSNQITAIDGTRASDRSGWQVGIDGGWQQINSRGGYGVNAQASLNQGVNGVGDIRSTALGGHWMQALTSNWLARVSAQISDYRDDDQPAYNNQATGGGLTLGWFGPQNSGLDLTVVWQQEQYDDNPDMAYAANRYTFSSVYYYGHDNRHAYWSLGVAAGRFDADLQGYSYDSYRLTLAYNAWRWQKLKGNLQLQWRTNRFDNSPTQTAPMNPGNGSMGSGMPGTPPIPSSQASLYSAAQNDTYLTTTLSLSYPLGELWHIRGDLNAGQYQSNLAQERPLASGYIGVSVSF